MKVMDEDEKDGKDGVQVNPSEGRVPVSWNECADWRERWPDRVLYRPNEDRPWKVSSRSVWSITDHHHIYALSDYRLLPPPNLVAAPEGMDGGGWLGQGKDVPDGWEWRWRITTDDRGWYAVPTISRIDGGVIVQCRPPAPKREPEWVPLTKLVGRTVWGETEAVVSDPCPTAKGWVWPSARTIKRFPDGTLDLDTGRVKVEPEEEQ